MDRHDFDDLTRALAHGSDRRTLLKRLVGGAIGGALVLRAGTASAQNTASTCRGLAESCNTDGNPCCSGLVCTEEPDNSGRTACMPEPEVVEPVDPVEKCRECERRCRVGRRLGPKHNRHRTCKRVCHNVCGRGTA